MSCQRCDSERICSINAKSSDLNNGYIMGKSFDGYVPEGLGIGGGDYVKFSWCLECGQIQGEFPLDTPDKFVAEEEDEEPIDMEGSFDG